MFSSTTSVVGEPLGYDFTKEENAAKWKGVFVNSLKKVLEQVHPSLEARQDALDYVENLILRLLGMLCGYPPPHTTQDVEERVQRTFPNPIDKWALKDAKETLEKGKKKSVLVLPVEKVHQLLQKEVLQHKIDWQVTHFVVGVLEYISADIFKLAGNYVKNRRHVEISDEDIKVAMYADNVLMDMFYQDDCNEDNTQPEVGAVLSLTYEDSVREFIKIERSYLKDLQMIIKVFREEITKLTQDHTEIEMLFSNIMDIYDTTVNLLGSVEDVLEMTEEKQTPAVGSCFEELAEAEEFDVYSKYARDISSPNCREVLTRLLSRPESNAALRAAGHSFREAVKYYLPKLLMHPVWHCVWYFESIKVLQKLTQSDEERETLEQVGGLLRPLQKELQDITDKCKFMKDSNRLSSRARRQAALEKNREMIKTIDGWDPKDIENQCTQELIREGMLAKVGNNYRRLSDRKAILFDGMLVLSKPCSSKRVSVSVTAVAVTHHQSDLRLKEVFYIRKIDIIDREDTEELKNAFEIAPRDHSNVVLVAKSVEDKNNWMADIVMLNTKSMLERTLNSILTDEEQKHPLKLPPPSMYKFAEPDSPDNIVVEAKENGGVPLIKGATLEKLVEKLTNHIAPDSAFARTFLITYRSFCSPQDLLTLLIERFEIPDPALVYGEEMACKTFIKEDFKRYRREFCQQVQMRVLVFIRNWVRNYFYDFEMDSNLLDRLLKFLGTVSELNCKPMKNCVHSITTKIQKICDPLEKRPIIFSFERSPPPIEWHLKVPEEEWNILTLHPIELARQLTIYEWELFKKVKPSELVGSGWTKKDKEKISPNLLKIIKCTTNFTRWLEKYIVEAENFEERVAIVCRAIEIMMVMQDLNNFNGVLAISSAMQSASVFRLNCTTAQLPVRYKKVLEEAGELNTDHYKRYIEKLRSTNPPCVPFFGMYLTNILHLEEGNPDFLTDTNLINFSKRRKVAEIIVEVQQYQNTPYCLSIEPRIRHFIENICPFPDPEMTDADISTYLYNKSMEIEPRNCKVPLKAPRKWPDISLKSPGIKARSLSGKLPAPLQAVASSVRLHDPPTASQELPTSSELPETPPQGSSFSLAASDRDSVFAPVLLGGANVRSPGSPSAALSISNMSINSPGSSPQLGSPGHLTHQYQASMDFNSSMISTAGGLFPSMSSLSGSPGAMQPPPPSPSNLPPFGQPPPPPLPPRSHRRRENSLADSPQQARQAPDAPLLPPRGFSPPPLPPRRDVSSSSTLPPRFPATLNPSSSALLARRNSNLDSSCPINTGHTRRHMSFNGPSPTKLPPTQPPNGSIRLPPKPQIPGRPPATMFNFNAPPGPS